MTVALIYLLGLVIAIMIFVQGMSRKVELFSIRNLYLAGFVVYHVLGPAKMLSTGDFLGFAVNSPETTGRWLLLYIWVYFLVYMFSYHRIKLVRRLASKFSAVPLEMSDTLLLSLAVALLTASIPMRFFGGTIPVVGKAMLHIALALTAVSCALAGWVWSKHKFNVAVTAMTAVIVIGCIGFSVYGIFGRRPLIGVLFGFAWGAYYRWAQYISPAKLVAYMVPLLLGAVLIVSAWTAIRRDATQDQSASIHSIFQSMVESDVAEGSERLASGQGVPGAMLWVLEQYPRYLQPKPLFSLRYMAMYFIPRDLWPNKPEPLSTQIGRLALLKGVNRKEIKIPPGVVGYAAAEGGFYALLIYALFFGQFTRYFDEVVRQNPFSPLIIIPCGCVTGQFLGLARGGIAVFTDIIVVSFLGTMALMLVVKFLFGRRSAMPHYAPQWSPPGYY